MGTAAVKADFNMAYHAHTTNISKDLLSIGCLIID
jgi:hypothetical protein